MATAVPPSDPSDGGIWRFLRIRGENLPVDEWPVLPGRDLVLGRMGPTDPPGLDLSPDLSVSRQHARVCADSAGFRVEDLGSRGGTFLAGNDIRGRGPVALSPGTELRIGESVWVLASPAWHRLKWSGLVLDLETAAVLNYSLVHCGVPIVRRMIARNLGPVPTDAGRFEFSIPGLATSEVICLGPLGPGESCELPPPPIEFDMRVLEDRADRHRVQLETRHDGELAQGSRVAIRVLAHNEWSCRPDDRVSLAAFVLPNHPLVQHLAHEACGKLSTSTPPGKVLEALYAHLADAWSIAYRRELPGADPHRQRVRLPHHVLLGMERATGEGTCLDLALLVAGCLEHLGVQSLLSILATGEGAHALVGCWERARPSLEPVLFDSTRVIDGACWIDPTGLTHDPALRMDFSASIRQARRLLEQGPLQAAIDVSAARGDGIEPLPFRGAPRWSDAVARALSLTERMALEGKTPPSLVTLLLGLLGIEGGVTRKVLGVLVPALEIAIAGMLAASHARDSSPESTRQFEAALDLARSRAKSQGSDLVLEGHVLAAVLELRSESMRLALEHLGTTPDAVLNALLITEARTDLCSGSLLESSIHVTRY